MPEVIAFHRGACQVAGRLPLDARAVKVGLLAFSLAAAFVERAARRPVMLPEQPPLDLHVCGALVPLRGRRGDVALRPLAAHPLLAIQQRDPARIQFPWSGMQR